MYTVDWVEREKRVPAQTHADNATDLLSGAKDYEHTNTRTAEKHTRRKTALRDLKLEDLEALQKERTRDRSMIYFILILIIKTINSASQTGVCK